MINREPQNVLTARARLGEGPVWDGRSQLLYWVDIYNHRVHQFNPATGSDRFFDVGETVGAIAVVDSATEPQQLIMALRHGLAYLNLQTGAVTPIMAVEGDKLSNRFNDGKCDTVGRFWVGSMCSEGQEASLYRYGGRGELPGSDAVADRQDGMALSLARMEEGLTISNGLGWSPDNSTFYLTDSPLQQIFAYDFDATTGTINNRRLFIDLTHESFFPDGLTVDAEGCLWVAMWDGWCVVRFDPAGKEIGRVQLPVQRPTSCTFGGPDLETLYITTASVGLSEAEIQASFFSGDVFCVETDTTGLPNHRFTKNDAS